MRIGYQLAQALKEIQSENVRMARALLVAQACAYQVTLDPSKSCEALCEEKTTIVKKIVGEVNEYAPLDTSLTLTLFTKLVHTRYELAFYPGSAALLEFVLTTDEQTSQLSDEQTATLKALVSNSEFRRFQAAVKTDLAVCFDPVKEEVE
jgi:hypothetical protein